MLEVIRMPDSQLVDYSVAAFIFTGMIFVLVKTIDLFKAMNGTKKDPINDLSKAIQELTNFLREDKASQREINKAVNRSFETMFESQDKLDLKLDKILDTINNHVLLCQKCIHDRK